MKILNGISNIGIHEGTPPHIATKVRFCNLSALIFIFVVLPYVYFTYVNYPEIWIVPAMIIPVNMLILLLNYLRIHSISRFLMSTSLSVVAATYHAYLVSAGEDLIYPLYSAQLAVMLLPLLMYDFRELFMLVFVLLLLSLLYYFLPEFTLVLGNGFG